MKFGISVSQVHEVDLVVQAENVGYDFCWVWDSPMIRSNLWALLALVAHRTHTISIGPGVAIPALAMAPVTANAIATINAIAPGRTFWASALVIRLFVQWANYRWESPNLERNSR